MGDKLITAVSTDGAFRIFAVNATETVQTAQQRHDTWSAASAALGRTLVATSLLAAAGLKNDDDLLTVRLKGDGPVGAIVADGTAQGTVRGYIQNPHVTLPLNPVGKIDVARAVGHTGLLAVTKSVGVGDPFTGQVPLVSGELGEDFTYYLAKSEQIPAAVGLSVFVNADNTIQVAGGFMVQALPGASDDALAQVETTLKTLPLVSEMLKAGLTPEQIAAKVMGATPINVVATAPLSFACTCSKVHFAEIIATLAPSDIRQMIEEDHGASVTCKFCGARYAYSEAELTDLLRKAAPHDN
ncbi:Hsp33 family molecular chaperone HslO [Lacticaseibacillus daqingensis]|uniref:Hsp33 family molecular chaperone HslO n=1 Tax=Lacticaseibacillus daqingensis TaxID=2486014 RepID=UPI000F7B2A3A|nr:Hsp33 family molecular chaperone HslO [Lacticaseibacillus daqingensis]